MISGINYPVIWKNGVRNQLSTPQSIATAVFVYSSDVYVSGTENMGTSTPMAVIWKNGVKTRLSSALSGASSLFVNASGVYVVGLDRDYATIWKDGVSTRLNGGLNSCAYAVTAAGSDIYAVGFDMLSNKTYASQWKNSSLKTQLGSVAWGEAWDIEVVNGDSYVAGNDGGACYWKNGIKKQLSADPESVAYGIEINGSDVYVSGYENIKACYWKNGVKVSVSDVQLSAARSIAVF